MTISKMNLFNQKYHIQIHMLKLQHEKKKNREEEGFYGKRNIGKYI